MGKMHGMHAVDAASAAAKNHEDPKVYYPELHFEGEQSEHLIKHLKKAWNRSRPLQESFRKHPPRDPARKV